MSDQQHMFGKTVSKVERYDWAVVDRPGKFQMLDKVLLHIDHTYQRDNVNEARVNAMACAWSWAACCCLSVARRSDGSLWVFDGQHRKLAADKRADIRRLPCMVFDIVTSGEEAGAFLSSNTARGPVSRYHVFRAQLVKGDQLAIALRDVIASTGYAISRRAHSERQMACIGVVYGQFIKDRGVAEGTWRLCVEICDNKSVNNKLFAGLCYLEHWLRKNSFGSVHDEQNKMKLLRKSQAALLRDISTAVANNGKGGAAVYAEGLKDVLNHRRHDRNKLPSVVSNQLREGRPDAE